MNIFMFKVTYTCTKSGTFRRSQKLKELLAVCVYHDIIHQKQPLNGGDGANIMYRFQKRTIYCLQYMHADGISPQYMVSEK